MVNINNVHTRCEELTYMHKHCKELVYVVKNWYSCVNVNSVHINYTHTL